MNARPWCARHGFATYSAGANTTKDADKDPGASKNLYEKKQALIYDLTKIFVSFSLVCNS